MFQKERFVERNANALAAGRVAGVDAIEQITKRCIRIVNSPGSELGSVCVLCRLSIHYSHTSVEAYHRPFFFFLLPFFIISCA